MLRFSESNPGLSVRFAERPGFLRSVVVSRRNARVSCLSVNYADFRARSVRRDQSVGMQSSISLVVFRSDDFHRYGIRWKKPVEPCGIALSESRNYRVGNRTDVSGLFFSQNSY